jgi:predicted phage terminase large subunit-like protein
MKLKQDAQGKQKWFNLDGGGVYATSAGGAITGFGAGSTTTKKGFGGAIIIDDPLKPDDSFSEVKRKAVNERYNNTIRSRVNSRETPIIIIMQRLHEEDLSGYLLDGGSGEDWTHLCLPALDEDNTPLWEQKHTFKELEQIRQANRYTFAGQYMQTPAPDEGGEWRKEWFEIVEESTLPKSLTWTLLIDGAYTKNTKNDPTGLQIGAKHNNNYYILSSIDKYMELPELVKFIPEHITASGVNVTLSKVEPKASGKSIAQLIRSETRLNIAEIRTDFVNMSKIECARMSSPYIEGGRVKLVKGTWNEHFLNQVGTFPNAKHDEHVDLTCYGIEDNLINGFGIEIG